MNILFKTLCEIKLLHEYYLTERDGNTIFDITEQEGRLAFLQNKLIDNYPSINDDLSFEIHSSSRNIFSGHQLKLIPSYSGFQITIAVTEKERTGGGIAYEPKIPLPGDRMLTILLRRKNAMLDMITNVNLQNPVPSAYFFTNQTLSATKTYPYLSLPVSPRNPLLSYRQGDLVFEPADNTVKAFYIDRSGAEQWAPVKGEGYITESDRLLVPPRFFYTFPATGVSEASFTLADHSGNVIKAIQYEVDQSKRVLLDLEDAIDSPAVFGPSVIYSLKVTANNGFQAVHSVIFNTSQLPADTWGLVVLQPGVEQSAYRLLDDEGMLFQGINASGDAMLTPQFEIRIKSRLTFWRYRNNNRKKIKANSSLDPYLFHDASKGVMETITLRNATYVPTIFKDGSNSKYLPNPSSFELLGSEGQRMYTEVSVPRSNMFEV
jgi:hypothetical protein